MLARPPTRSSYLWVQVPLNIPPLEGHHGHVQETHVRPEPLANLHVPRGCPLMFMSGDGHQPSADSIGHKHEGTQDSNAKDGLHLLSIMACAVGCICYIRGEHLQGAPRMVVLLCKSVHTVSGCPNKRTSTIHRHPPDFETNSTLRALGSKPFACVIDSAA